MSTLSISLPEREIKRIDSEISRLGFATRSEFIRAVMRGYFNEKTNLLEYESVPLEQIHEDLIKTDKYSKKFINSVIVGLADSSVYKDKKSSTKRQALRKLIDAPETFKKIRNSASYIHKLRIKDVAVKQ